MKMSLVAILAAASCGRIPAREAKRLAPPPDVIPAAYTVGIDGDAGLDADPTSLPPLPDAGVPVDVLVPFEPPDEVEEPCTGPDCGEMKREQR
jgi:hypothetical protein